MTLAFRALFVAACVLGAVAATARPASAYTGPNPIGDPARWATVMAYSLAPPSSSTPLTTAQKTRLWLGRVGAARLPSPTLGLGAVSLGPIALGTGWTIGGALNEWLHISAQFGPGSGASGACTFNSVRWESYSSSALSVGRRLTADLTGCVNATVAFTVHKTCVIGTQEACLLLTNGARQLAQKTYAEQNVTGGAWVPDSGDFYTFYITAAAFDSAFQVDEMAPYAGQPYGFSTNHTPPAAPAFPDPAAEQARSVWLGGDHASDAAIGRALDPAWDGPSD
jgi:hypothetical protein